MLKDNKDFSSPKKGMNTDTSPSEMQSNSYSFALNANYEDSSGNLINLQNEHSNILCSKFNDGFVVIGFEVDIVTGRTYYFLVNPTTNCSEIGVIKNLESIDEAEDTLAQCGCNAQNILAEGLETAEQIETCTYETIITDCGCGDGSQEGLRCLNFSINHPIDADLKKDKASDVLYFTDDLNPRRRLELNRLDQYYSKPGGENCGDEEEPVCLNCNRMLVQKPYKVPRFSNISVNSGGFLKHGIYSFVISYCDQNGNKMSRYMSMSRETFIKDENKTIYQQPELDARTNLAIRLDVENIDTTFEYYKVVAIQITSVDGAYSLYEVGKFPTTQNTIIYSNQDNLQRVTIEEVAYDFPLIKTARSQEIINNMLFYSDLTTQPEVNLQPVVNLMGQFAKWRTAIAEEDLYKRPELARIYKQYTRDEVYPHSIRFFNDEYVTANFPLISRVATDSDLYFDEEGSTANDLPEDTDDLIDWQTDVYSVLRSGQCGKSERKYRWQFYNTATKETDDGTRLWEQLDCDLEVPYTLVKKTLTRYCTEKITEDLANVTTFPIEITEFFDLETFDSLSNYIRYLYSIGEEDSFPLLANLNSSISCDELNCVPDALFPDLDECTESKCEDEDEPCCGPLTLANETVEFYTIPDEDNVLDIEIIQKCDTSKPDAPDSCYNIKTDSNGENVDLVPTYDVDDCQDIKDEESGAEETEALQDLTWEFLPVIFGDWDEISENGWKCKKIRRRLKKIQVWERIEPPYGGSNCSNADTLPLNISPISTHLVPHFFTSNRFIFEIFNDYSSDPSATHSFLGNDISDYKTQIFGATGEQIRKCKRSYEIVNGDIRFFDRVSKNALWFKLENITAKDWIYFGISEEGGCPSGKKRKDCLTYPDQLRYTVYLTEPGGNCTKEFTDAATFNREQGAAVCLNLTDYTYDGNLIGPEDTFDIYIAVDAPYLFTPVGGNWQGVDIVSMGYTGPTCGCINIEAKNAEIEKVVITEKEPSTISVQKTCEYTKECCIKVIGDIKCAPVPWDEGAFSYWESTEVYPDNEHLYDSSQLTVNTSDIPERIRTDFELAFVGAITPEDDYIWKEDDQGVLVDYRCRPIRHFRYPCENTTYHHDGNLDDGGNGSFTGNKIFPLGFYLDNEVVNAFLDLAVKNNLITQEFRDSIKGYELFTGDIRVDQSVLGKGILIDNYRYKEEVLRNDVNLFPNFPYNQLGTNTLIFEDKDRTTPLDHPYSSERNNRFMFHSPEYQFNRPLVPFETIIKSWELGESKGKFSDVYSHPQMVLLSPRAEALAKSLAITEELIDIILYSVGQFVVAGTGGLSTPIALGLAGAASAVRATNAVFNIPVKTFEWTKIIYEFGNPNNFAAYYSSEGFYNSYVNNVEGNKLRLNINSKFLKSGRHRFAENDFTNTNVSQEEVIINNVDRESALYLSFGLHDDAYKYKQYATLEHLTKIRNYDTSRFYASQEGVCSEDDDNKKSFEIVRSIANPYAVVKLYIPSQHGTIDNIQWLSMGRTEYLADDNSCHITFGGDSFISRFTFKQKFPFFINPMIIGKNALADRTAFNYEEQRNVGFPKFYIKYKTAQASTLIGLQLPPLKSEFNLDCTTVKKMYVQPPSKFYLYYYGIPNFLVESKFNLNQRYGKDDYRENFYPNSPDYVEWTQEWNTSIKESNYYYYNPTYSMSYESLWYTTRKLPFSYDPVDWALRSDYFDRTVYSLTDNNEQDTLDNFRVFLARNNYFFGSRYGRFIGLKGLASQRALGRFENGIVIFNAYNTLSGDVEDVQLGTGDMFKTRPTEFFQSDLGHGGTQHKAFVSCQYGHFWTDALRGRVYQVNSNGEGLEEISSYGMKHWFRENLPFRIKKQFPDIPLEMIDNNYKGLGISMMWDDRYTRVFVTKNDVILKPEFLGKVEIVDNDFLYTEKEGDDPIVINVQDGTYFIDVSWTVAYSPLTKSWLSYYSFIPNYYVSLPNYFKSGLNFGDKKGVYNHLLTNKSFQVFYGDLYPFQVEYVLQSKNINKLHGSVKYWLDVKRYHNEFDSANNNQLGFNKAWVYGDSENTGQLNLVKAVQNNLYQQVTYPQHNADSIDILYTAEDRHHSFNYIFDNVIDKFNNIPIWVKTPNNVNKDINPLAIDYRPYYKNYLQGDWAKVKLSQDTESRYKFIVKWLESNNKFIIE